MTDTDWTTWTDEDLVEANEEIWKEQQRRNTINSAQQNIQNENLKYLDAAGYQQGDAWAQPTGAHDSYPLDWTVTHNAKTWTSLLNGNVWEPPTNWREVVPTGTCPDFVPPTGASDAYKTGDCVTYQGQCYTSLIDANVWAPPDYPAGWEERPC